MDADPNGRDGPDRLDGPGGPGEPEGSSPASGSIKPDAKPALRGNTLTHALAEHPLGTVMGAIAGLAIGGLIGIAAGPVGSLAGAVCGAAIGILLATGYPGASKRHR